MRLLVQPKRNARTKIVIIVSRIEITTTKRLHGRISSQMSFIAGTQLYCSRDCRRAHWEKHRKACLHSRVSVLCRQVLSACKDDTDTLSHLSILARRGYLSNGKHIIELFRLVLLHRLLINLFVLI